MLYQKQSEIGPKWVYATSTSWSRGSKSWGLATNSELLIIKN